MIAASVVFLLSLSANICPSTVPAHSESKIEERKPVSKEVKRAAADYAETILEAIKILNRGHVKKVSKAQLARWAIRGLFERSGALVPGDIAERMLALRDPGEDGLEELLREARIRLGQRSDLAEFRDMDRSLQGIFEHLEPETKLTPLREEGPSCVQRRWGRAAIGVLIDKDEKSDFPRVVTPIKDSPAYKAGIRAGDVITRIVCENENKGDGSLQTVSTKGLSIREVNERLCGNPDTKIRLSVYREDPTKRREVVIVRGWYDREVLFGVRRKADDNWDFLLDAKNKIAYVCIPKFSRDLHQEFVRTLTRLERQGMKGLILDLRGNPGGLLDVTVDCAELFLEKNSLVVTIRRRDGKEDNIRSESRGRFRRTPVVCLIDRNNGGSSELFGACLQDHHRAVIIGERSSGNLDARQVAPLPHGDLTFVSAAFYRPNGRPISKVVTSGKEEDDWGVRPDKGFVVKLTSAERKEVAEHLRRLEIILPSGRTLPACRDRQLEKALEYLRKQANQARS